MTKDKFVWALLAACVALIFLNYYQYGLIKSSSRQPAFFKTDQDYVNDAINTWSEVAKEKPKIAMRDRYAVAMHFPEEVCVELRLKLGSAGGSPVYCFDRKSHGITRKFDSVE